MEKVIKRLTAASTWAASADLTPIDVLREGLITEFTIRANTVITFAATGYGDAFRRVLQNIKLEGDGGRSFLGMSGTQMSVLLSLWGEALFNMPTVHSNGADIALAAPDVGSAAFTSVFKFHPGSNPKDPFDLTAAIPARALSTLQAKLTTVAAAALGSGGGSEVITTASTFNYEVAEVLNIPVPASLMVPLGSTLAYAHTGNYSDFSYEIDIPSGAWLRSIILLIRDHTTASPWRKDDEVTGIRIRKPKSGQIVLEQNIYEAKQSMAARFGMIGCSGEPGVFGAIASTREGPADLLHVVPAGFVIIDLRAFFNPLYGLDLRAYQTGDYKLGLTIANNTSGDSTTIYWDQLLPVDPQYVGK